MNILLIYDITEDRLRTKVADMCKDYGLARVQYSSFFGQISRNLCEELAKRLKDYLQKTACSSIIIFPLSQDNLDHIIQIDINYTEMKA
jgi:CRISPR-associated protein Cas2